MSAYLPHATSFVFYALLAAGALAGGSRLLAAEPTIGKKCDTHAREWEQLQADKKFTLEKAAANKEDYDAAVRYYAQKEALLLHRMFFCDRCSEKTGTVGELPPTTGGGDAKVGGPVKNPADERDVVGVLGEPMTAASRNIKANREHDTFRRKWDSRRIAMRSIVRIDAEEMELDGDSGTLTPVSRGANKTSPQAHAADAKIYLVKRAPEL